MPESPRWQYAKGQQTEAQAGAVKLWGQSGPDQLSEGTLPLAHAKDKFCSILESWHAAL